MNIRKSVRLGCAALTFLTALVPVAAEDFTKDVRVAAGAVFPGADWEREPNGLSAETVQGVDAFVHIAIKLDPEMYDAYAGEYVMAPEPKLPGTVTLTIKRQGDALFRQVPGWFGQEIFPESETTFFNATEDEQLTFVKNNKGEVTGLIMFDFADAPRGASVYAHAGVDRSHRGAQHTRAGRQGAQRGISEMHMTMTANPSIPRTGASRSARLLVVAQWRLSPAADADRSVT